MIDRLYPANASIDFDEFSSAAKIAESGTGDAVSGPLPFSIDRLPMVLSRRLRKVLSTASVLLSVALPWVHFWVQIF